MPQFAHTCKTTTSALVPCPLLLSSYPVSSPLKDHLRMSGATLKEKIASNYMPSLRTRVTSTNAPPSPTVSNAATVETYYCLWK